MKQFLVATSLAVAMSMSLMSTAPLSAKPADLPADDKIQCPDGQEKGEHGGIALDLSEPIAPADPGNTLDAVSPIVLGMLLDQWLDAIARLAPASTDPREQQARQAFDAAERARRAGNYAAARTDYQQVHLLAPTSRLGRLAIDRLIEIEQRLRDASEEAEPNPQPMRRSSLDGYQPLGLVELTY